MASTKRIADMASAEFQEYKVPLLLPFSRLLIFCGRQDTLNEVAKALKPESEPKHSRDRKEIVLHGMGGLGKSQIALEYAYCYGDHCSAVLWVDATTNYATKYRNQPEQMFSNIAIDLKIPGQIDNTGQVIGDRPRSPWRVVRNWLARIDNYRWLLIADGPNDEEDSERLLKVLPAGSQGHITVTSRVTLAGFTIVDVPVMDKVSGVRLPLGNKFSSATQQVKETVEQIVDMLGNLPLALAQAAAYINMRRLDFSRYLERLRKDFDSLIGQIAIGYWLKYGLAKRLSVVSTDSKTVESIWIQRWARNTLKGGELSICEIDQDTLHILPKQRAQEAVRLVGYGITDIDSEPKSCEWVYERENWAQLKLCCDDYILKYKFENDKIDSGKLGRAMRKLGDWKNR
ncbi:hypothetical protein TWF703_011272 [Orbilia oligospora]|uniref:NB-ARC domain-containing protein n=1 Tax=Orbilia oligospora TaxID=2813651 RepID=A0A7C8NPM4_ORBOL|nr:hypothetical protein TWF703_011272 [Orbilia oligospora]